MNNFIVVFNVIWASISYMFQGTFMSTLPFQSRGILPTLRDEQQAPFPPPLLNRISFGWKFTFFHEFFSCVDANVCSSVERATVLLLILFTCCWYSFWAHRSTWLWVKSHVMHHCPKFIFKGEQTLWRIGVGGHGFPSPYIPFSRPIGILSFGGASVVYGAGPPPFMMPLPMPN